MSGKCAVGSVQWAAAWRRTLVPAAYRLLPTAHRRSGFTLVEIMVAITVATILFGICTAIFVKVSQYKARSEKMLFMAEEANGAMARVARDLQGLHVAGNTLGTYWRAEGKDAGFATFHKVTFLTATENPGKADYCTISYDVQNGSLIRNLSDAMGGVSPGASPWSDKVTLAEGVQAITFQTLPPEFADDPPPAALDRRVPKLITVTLQMSDPDGRPPYRRFTITVRPGSEENP